MLVTDGAVSGGTPVTEMSSMPTHSSVPGCVGRDDPHLDHGLIVRGRRQRHADRRDKAGLTWPARRVGHVPGRQIGERSGRGEAVLEGDLLEGVVRGAIDIAKVVGDVDVRQSGGVDRDHDARGVGRRRALDRDNRVGELELGHSPLPEARWIGLVGDYGQGAAVDGDLLRIGSGHGDVRPEESGHPWNPVPVVVGRDEPRVRPVLGERQGLGRRVGGDGYHRKNGEQQGADKAGDGGPMSGGWDQHGGEPPRK